eukprot:s361_g23.t1
MAPGSPSSHASNARLWPCPTSIDTQRFPNAAGYAEASTRGLTGTVAHGTLPNTTHAATCCNLFCDLGARAPFFFLCRNRRMENWYEQRWPQARSKFMQRPGIGLPVVCIFICPDQIEGVMLNLRKIHTRSPVRS